MEYKHMTGPKLKVHRLNMGLSQKAFWEPGCAGQAVASAYENGRRIPDAVKKLMWLRYGANVPIDAPAVILEQIGNVIRTAETTQIAVMKHRAATQENKQLDEEMDRAAFELAEALESAIALIQKGALDAAAQDTDEAGNVAAEANSAQEKHGWVGGEEAQKLFAAKERECREAGRLPTCGFVEGRILYSPKGEEAQQEADGAGIQVKDKG